jgi:putative RNA 2'-phosphotransferase
MEPQLVKISKFISLMLRHDPGRFGLTLDPQGWVAVDELLTAAARGGVALDDATLRRIVAENDKQRFAFSPDGRRIRANQGHSVEVDRVCRRSRRPNCSTMARRSVSSTRSAGRG